MKTRARYLAEAEEKARGKSFVQLMYEFYTGGFRPQRPAAKVLEFPDHQGIKRADGPRRSRQARPAAAYISFKRAGADVHTAPRQPRPLIFLFAPRQPEGDRIRP
jgi:hypothetical protein